MLNLFRTYKWFFTIFFLFIAFALVVLWLVPQKESVLALNGIDHPLLDSFFFYMTMMGEVLGGVVVALILIFRKSVKYVIFLLIAILISTSVSSSLKNFVFDKSYRPLHHYGEAVRVVNGDKLNRLNSFPSGHTTAAFCMFGFLAFAMKKNNWQIWAVSIACLVGISRVYLGQHFPADVLAGSWLGTLVALLVFLMIPDVPAEHWLNKRVSGNE